MNETDEQNDLAWQFQWPANVAQWRFVWRPIGPGYLLALTHLHHATGTRALHGDQITSIEASFFTYPVDGICYAALPGGLYRTSNTALLYGTQTRQS